VVSSFLKNQRASQSVSSFLKNQRASQSERREVSEDIGDRERSGERRDLRYDYISFVDFFIFNLNGLLKGVYGIARLKNSKQTEQNNWTVQFLDAF
jgi:hypothetical protein